MTYTTAQKLNNVNAAARDAYAAVLAAVDALDGVLMMSRDVNARDLSGVDAGPEALEATIDLTDDIALDLVALSGVRRRLARLARLTNKHIIPASQA